MKFIILILALGSAQSDDLDSTMESGKSTPEEANTILPSERKFPPDNISPRGRETNLVNDEAEGFSALEVGNAGPTENMGTFTATATATTISPGALDATRDPLRSQGNNPRTAPVPTTQK